MRTIVIGSEGTAKKCAGKFIERLLRITYPDIKIVWRNDKSCDLIVRTHFKNVEPYWNRKKVPYIYWSGESRNVVLFPYHKNCVSLMSTIIKMPNLYYCPFATSSPYLTHLDSIRKFEGSKTRPYKVAYCSSLQVTIREKLFNLFAMRNKDCHALGKCCGNFSGRKRKIPDNWRSPNLLETYSQYDFVFALENTLKQGYITEKILNAFASGAVPIYWGDNIVEKFFNPKAFINVRKFKSLEACVIHVLSLSKERIYSMMSEPIFNQDTDQDFLDMIQFGRDGNKYYQRVSEHIFSMIEEK